MANTMTSKNINSHVNLSHCSRCQGDTKYYCLTCEQNLCPACKIKHSINRDTKEHDTRLYKYKNTIPRTREPCKNHPSKDYEKYCKDCDIPLCEDCKEHKEHRVRDVMTVYKQQEKTINSISREILYTLQVLLVKIKRDFVSCKNKTAPIVSEIAEELQKVKDQLDAVSIDAYISRKGIKRSLTEKLRNQMAKLSKHLFKAKIYDNSQHKFAYKPIQFLRFIKKSRSSHIEMTPVQHSLLSPTKVDVRSLTVLLDEIQYTERGKRTLEKEHLLRLMSVPESQIVGKLNNFASCEHISCVTRDQVWVSERNKLALIDTTTGNIIQTVNDVVNGFWWGLHTLNTDCELYYISTNNSIMKISNDRKTATPVFTMKGTLYQPKSLFCSLSTGDILIGMTKLYKNLEIGIVAKLKENSPLTIIIPNDYKHHTLFKDPNYITENNNGDIVVSDYWRGLVVTDHEGNHRFSYTETPFGSKLLPRGICTDALSNILVCDFVSKTIQILDKGGNFLQYIPTERTLGPLGKPCSLSYDWNTHLLWVGSWNNTVSRYRHINRHLDLIDSRELCAGRGSCSNIPMPFENYSQELNSESSVFLRGLIKLPTSTEVHVPIPRANEVIVSICEAIDELIKARTRTLRPLHYHITEEEAEEEIIEEIFSKLIATIHTNGANIMRTKGEYGKEKEIKSLLLEIESYIFNVAQKTAQSENDTSLDILEILGGLMEKIENFSKLLPSQETNKYLSGLRDYVVDISNKLRSIFTKQKKQQKFDRYRK